MFSIQSTTVSQCPAKVFSESKILIAPIFNLNALMPFKYRLKCSKAIHEWMDGWMGMEISVSTSAVLIRDDPHKILLFLWISWLSYPTFQAIVRERLP